MKRLWILIQALAKIAWEGIKHLGEGAFNVTRVMIADLGTYMGNAGWNPYQIAMATNLLRYPIKAWERLASKGIETAPALVGAFVPKPSVNIGVPAAATKAAETAAAAVAAAGYGAGGFNMGAGLKRKTRRKTTGRLKKGSPEAKAHMAYLRSLRRR